uniref:Uncharacterized protein n=1 Tax=Acrobeloides nanus TaxID=290746 RepID=A0A914D0J5_9BILA
MQLLTISLFVLCVATYVYGQYGYGGYGGRWGSDVHDQMETREKSQYGYGAHHIHTDVFHELPFGHKCELNFG